MSKVKGKKGRRGKKGEAGLELDETKLLKLFEALNSKNQIRVFKKALKESNSIIAREAKRTLKQKIGAAATHEGRYGKLVKGIRVTTDRERKYFGLKTTYYSKVHILGDFRLKFFEMGTKQRSTGGHYRVGANRGKMTANHFFTEAKERKMEEAKESLIRSISKSIKRVQKK